MGLEGGQTDRKNDGGQRKFYLLSRGPVYYSVQFEVGVPILSYHSFIFPFLFLPGKDDPTNRVPPLPPTILPQLAETPHQHLVPTDSSPSTHWYTPTHKYTSRIPQRTLLRRLIQGDHLHSDED